MQYTKQPADSAHGLREILANGQSAAIYDVCIKTMGSVGVALAMIGVIVCPITSGDTAFRSARLVLADWFKIDQNQIQKTTGALRAAAGSRCISSDIWIMRSYGDTSAGPTRRLAMIVSVDRKYVSVTVRQKNYWITAVPATFMSAVSMTYFCMCI